MDLSTDRFSSLLKQERERKTQPTNHVYGKEKKVCFSSKNCYFQSLKALLREMFNYYKIRGEYFHLFEYNHIGIVLEFQYFFGKVLTFGRKNSGKF